MYLIGELFDNSQSKSCSIGIEFNDGVYQRLYT